MLRGRFDPLSFNGVQLHGDHVDDILCYGVWDVDVCHKGIGRREVRRVHSNEAEFVNEFKRVGGGDWVEG